MYQKYKGILPSMLIFSSIVFYTSSLFVIGYIEGMSESDGGSTKVLEKDEGKQIIYERLVEKGSIVASKSGTKYYFTWCSGVSRIKEENKVYFESEEEARGRGLTLSKTCI